MTLIATEAERVLGSAEDSRLIASVGEARHKDTAWHLSLVEVPLVTDIEDGAKRQEVWW